jgi:hypothetical protein
MYAQPGELLKSYTFDGNCSEAKIGTALKNPANPSLGAEDIYYYGVDISFDPFHQTKDETYWVSIIANLEDTDKQWGWRESDRLGADMYINPPSVQDDLARESRIYPCGGRDLAFALTTQVPEPGSLLALGSGLTGLVGFFLKRRSA